MTSFVYIFIQRHRFMSGLLSHPYGRRLACRSDGWPGGTASATGPPRFGTQRPRHLPIVHHLLS